MFITIIETAGVRLWIVNYIVGANTAFLGEPFASDFTLEWPFTGVPPFVYLRKSELVESNQEEKMNSDLQVSELGEASPTTKLLARLSND